MHLLTVLKTDETIATSIQPTSAVWNVPERQLFIILVRLHVRCKGRWENRSYSSLERSRDDALHSEQNSDLKRKKANKKHTFKQPPTLVLEVN